MQSDQNHGYAVWSCWHGGETYSGFVGRILDMNTTSDSDFAVPCGEFKYTSVVARIAVPDSPQLRYMESIRAIFPGDLIPSAAIRMVCGGDWVYLAPDSLDGLDEAMARANAKAKLLGKVEWPLDRFRLPEKSED